MDMRLSASPKSQASPACRGQPRAAEDLTGSFYESLGTMGLLLVLAMGLLYVTLRQPTDTSILVKEALR